MMEHTERHQAVAQLRPIVAELDVMTDDELREYMLAERADDGGAHEGEAVEVLTRARNWIATQTGAIRQHFATFDRVLSRVAAMRSRLDREATR